MAKRVVVLHHPSSFLPLEVFRHVDGSVELIWAVDRSLGEDTPPRLLAKLGTYVDITGMSAGEAAASLARCGPDGLTTFVDSRLRLASELAERLGLFYHSRDVAERLVDKRLQRSALAMAGVPGPQFWTVEAGISPTALSDLACRVAYPAVLKPAEGTAGKGVRLVTGPSELEQIVRASTDAPGYLLETFITDSSKEPWRSDELVVESVVTDGHVSHAVITGRFPLAPPFRQTGSFLPRALPAGLRRRVLEVVEQAIEALGVHWALTHTELKLTPEGPKVIEVNGRLGGIVPFTLARVSRANLFQVACRVACGEGFRFPELVPCSDVAYWLRVLPPVTATRVGEVKGLGSLRDLPEVDSAVLHCGPGEPVDWRKGTASVVATVQGTVSTEAELPGTMQKINETLDIDYA
ncbi:MAG TPA: hypothetical protein VK425_04715 [Acidimicrobiales bacterium]|nr:hypothetical protein [Acidimicrobiales bacterium]